MENTKKEGYWERINRIVKKAEAASKRRKAFRKANAKKKENGGDP